MLCGLLLARSGVSVVVLEKHKDFIRDFRGDTIHASTMQTMEELGILEDFLKLPHTKEKQLAIQIGDRHYTVADFCRLPRAVRCRYMSFMPQWDFLDFLCQKALSYPSFRLIMEAEVIDVLRSGGQDLNGRGNNLGEGWGSESAKHDDTDNHIEGVRALTFEGDLIVRAVLTIAADGRHSVVRAKAGMQQWVEDLGAPFDALWLKLPREPQDRTPNLGRLAMGTLFVMLNRHAYWQCAYMIPKGGLNDLQSQGLEAFRQRLVSLSPLLANRVHHLCTWDDVKLLSVRVDRLHRWHRRGLLCIGDAAHAMSPVGGVGVNLALQDAVATANILTASLREGHVPEARLHAVQTRRMWPTKAMQHVQMQIQKRVIGRVIQLEGTETISVPLPFRILQIFPCLQALPAYLIGLGIRQEHVETLPSVAMDRESDHTTI